MTDNSFNKKFLEARRAVIARDFARLNAMQLQAVLTTEGPLLLLAGAGSGKTTVLISRIANLIRYGRGSDCLDVPDGADDMCLDLLRRCALGQTCESETVLAKKMCAVDPVEPWRIIAITFTNKAADELKERLSLMLGPEAEDIWAMTFHSACVRILRRHIDLLGFDRSFTIYDTADSQSVMKRVLKDLEMDEKTFAPRSVLAQISAAKDALMTPEDMMAEAEKSYDVRKKLVARAYAMYAKRLREADALDFDDLIYFTVRLLTDNAEVREYYQRKFKYVLIDEYQDTNNLQYLLASLLAGGHSNICVVGDDDQSIYKFRGATIENILSFESQYKDARVIRLEQNYRSTGNILDAANSVIRHNTARKGKKLWTEADKGDKLTLYVADDERDEAQYVAGKILAGFQTGMSWGDFAILYRMNAQSNQLEYALKRNGIPYRVVGGMRFFDRAEVKDMLAYLCVISNPSDDLRLARIINNPPRGIGTKTVEAAQEIAAAEGRPLFDVIADCRNYPELQKAAVRLTMFVSLIDLMRDAAHTMPLDELYDLVVDKTGYIRALEEKRSDENLARIENVGELKSNIIAFMKDSETPTLAGFLDEIALYTDLDQLSGESDCAIMMTMHSAKGLEFPTVFVVGAEDGIFPGMRAIGEPEEMEEERRLCYVAITRAKKKLYITAAHQRMLFGKTSSSRLSRFIDEIPQECLDRPQDVIAERRRERPADIYGEPRYSPQRAERRTTISPLSSPSGASASPPFKTGDGVEHRAFGQGVIVKLTPMAGGDALLEIEFEKLGTKRLMLKAAASNMKKI